MSIGERVVVIGGGTMGSGIAMAFAGVGVGVVILESTPEAASAARERLAAAGELAGRIRVSDDWDVPSSTVLVVEAVPESIGLKQEVLRRVESLVDAGCVIASNTSSLSIDELAAPLEHPERFLGMHFFNPVPRSALIELVIGAKTDERSVVLAKRWVGDLGKESIEVRDSPGFATSRLGLAVGLEAIRMLEEGVASARDIDRGMELGYRFPMGPLRLTDLVGLDVRLAIAEHLAATLGPRFEPPALLRDKVAAGHLGKKTGQGFYEW
jgi:3-hydroxybutyryl-CoA dehydrogenase